MKTKLFLVLACALLLITACITPAPMLITEGGKTIAQLGQAKFIVPPGFRVLNTMNDVDVGNMKSSAVYLGKAEEEVYTVIIFSMQVPGVEYQMQPIDLKKEYPDAFFIDESPGNISAAATYVANKSMARQIFVEKPLCKVVDGYHDYNSRVRYTFEIYQNFKGENPYMLCCGNKPPAKKDKDAYLKEKRAGKNTLRQFRNYALALIKDNYQMP